MSLRPSKRACESDATRSTPFMERGGKSGCLWWWKLTDLVLVALKVTSHFSPHLTTDARSVSRLFVTDAKSEVGDDEEYTVESSANMSTNELRISSGRSLMKIRNKVGPKTDPWGTPALIKYRSEDCPSRTWSRGAVVANSAHDLKVVGSILASAVCSRWSRHYLLGA